MSFGFAIGDFLAVLDRADRLRKDWLDAPKEYKSICASTRDVSNVLRDINDLADRTDLIEAQAEHLSHAISGCADVLESLSTIVAKYSTVSSSTDTTSGRALRMWKRFRTDPQDIRNVRHRLVAALASLNTAHSAILRTWTERIREDTQLLVQDKFDRAKLDIVNWLAPNTFAEHQSSYLSKRCSDTCNWFVEDAKFLHWRDHDAATLFCPGIPGTGKTVLAATVIDHLQELHIHEQDAAVVYHYYDIKRPDEKDPHHVLASFARQLLQQRDGVSSAATDLYEKYKTRNTRPTVKEIQSLYTTLVSEYQRVYHVIDAIDESDVHQNFQTSLLDDIRKVQASLGNIHLMVTSRHRPDILAYFDSCEQVCIRARHDDLDKYLDSRMPELVSGVGRIAKLQNEIKEQIIRSADGMFLLARLHFDSLCGETTPRAVLKALERLPKGSGALSIAYEAARERISQQLKGRCDLAMQTLMWISCGLREFNLRQLQHAIAVEPDMDDIEDEYDLASGTDLLSACAGLVVVDDESNVVHLVHLSLHEYLDRVRNDWFPDAYALVATKCINYLSLGVFGKAHDVQHLNGNVQVNQILRHPDFCGYSFLEHATKCWGFYAKKACDQELIKRLCLDLLARPIQWRNFCRLLACPHAAHFRAHAWWHEDVTPLHVSAYFGFENLAKELVASGHDLQSKDSHGMTALMWAVTNGQQEMVDFIFGLSDANVLLESDARGVTLLIFAAQNGHTEVVEFLLAQPSIDPNVLSNYDGTALNCAVSKGHIDTVRVILSHPSVKPRTRSEKTWSPLQYAAFNGHIEILILLLDQVHWELDDWELGESSLLHLAAAAGHIDIVELLTLRPEIDINAPDEKGSTPLAKAAQHQQSKIIKFLLAQPSICPDRKDNDGRTPLMNAIGSLASPKLRDVLAIIHHRGVDLNTCDKHGHSALVHAIKSSASRAGKIIIQALVSMPNVRVNSKDQYGYTPLHHAVLRHTGYSVRLLLQRDDVDPEVEAFDGHTACTLMLEEKRTTKALEEMLYGPAPTAQGEQLSDENGEPQWYQSVSRSLPMVHRCTAFRDPKVPYIVVVASSKEPNFSLSFYQRDFVLNSLKVQDVRMAVSSRWQVDVRWIQLKYKDINLSIGWSDLSSFYWSEGDTINAEITPAAIPLGFTTEEFAELDANQFNTRWQALRAASQKTGAARVGDNVSTNLGDMMSSSQHSDIEFALDMELHTSDEEDEEVRKFLSITGPNRKRRPRASSLEVQSMFFEHVERLRTTGSAEVRVGK